MVFVFVNWRVWVVLALLFLYALLRRLIKQKMDQRRTNTLPRSAAAIPRHLLGGDRTWIVFTTPMCTTCQPVVERLRAAEPHSTVLMIDATVERALADSLRVRSAPTAVIADRDGVVHTHLVGADAVGDYLDNGSAQPRLLDP